MEMEFRGFKSYFWAHNWEDLADDDCFETAYGLDSRIFGSWAVKFQNDDFFYEFLLDVEKFWQMLKPGLIVDQGTS